MNLLALYRAWARRHAAGELTREGERLGFYRPDNDSIPALLSPGAVWTCPAGHLGSKEPVCRCGQPMDWVVVA